MFLAQAAGATIVIKVTAKIPAKCSLGNEFIGDASFRQLPQPFKACSLRPSCMFVSARFVTFVPVPPVYSNFVLDTTQTIHY
jgi:hypothetical protein